MNPFEQIMQMMQGGGGISPMGTPSPMPSRPPMTPGGLPGAAPQPGMSTPSLNLGTPLANIGNDFAQEMGNVGLDLGLSAPSNPFPGIGADIHGAGQDAMHALGGLAPQPMVPPVSPGFSPIGNLPEEPGGGIMASLFGQSQQGSPPLGSGGAPQLPSLPQMDPSMAGALESGIKALGRLGQTPQDGGWNGSLPPLYQETDARGHAVPGGESYFVGDALKSAMDYVNPFAEASPESREQTVDAVRQQLEAIRASARGGAGQAADLAKKYRNQARQAKDPNRPTSAKPTPREGRGRGVLLPATNDKLEPIMAGQKTDSRAIDTRKSRFGSGQGVLFPERAHGVGGTKPSGQEEDSFLEDALMLPLRLPMYLRNFLQNTVGAAIHGGVSPQQRKLELRAEDQTQQYYQSIVSREFQLKKMENEMGSERFRRDILPMLGGLDQQIMNRKGGPDSATGRVGEAFINGLQEKEPGAFESLFMSNEETMQGIVSDAQKIANRTGLIDAKTQALLDVVKDKDKYTSEQLDIKFNTIKAQYAEEDMLSKLANRDSRTDYNRRAGRGGGASGGGGGGEGGISDSQLTTRKDHDNARTQEALDVLGDPDLSDEEKIDRIRSFGQEPVMKKGVFGSFFGTGLGGADTLDEEATRAGIAAKSHGQWGPGGGATAPPRMIGDRLKEDMKNQPDLRDVAKFMSNTMGGTEEENFERLRRSNRRQEMIDKYKASIEE